MDEKIIFDSFIDIATFIGPSEIFLVCTFATQINCDLHLIAICTSCLCYIIRAFRMDDKIIFDIFIDIGTIIRLPDICSVCILPDGFLELCRDIQGLYCIVQNTLLSSKIYNTHFLKLHSRIQNVDHKHRTKAPDILQEE